MPGQLLGTFPCRLVREDAIDPVGVGSPLVPFYLTIDAFQPRGAWIQPTFGVDASLSDQVAVPSGSAKRWWVLYTDLIHWHSKPYWRAYLVPLPLPAPVGSGGVVVDGSGIVSFADYITGSGGVLVSGSAHRIVARHFTGSGGVLVDGSAVVYNTLYFLGSGGAIGNSGAVIFHAVTITGSGGVIANSAAEYSHLHVLTGSGGAIGNSAAAWSSVKEVMGAGGLLADGLAGWVYEGSGGGPPPHGQGTVVYVDNPTGNPILTTFPDHGLSGQKTLLITGCTNNPGANGTYLCVVLSGNTFSEFQFPIGTQGTESNAFWYLQ